ncbi:hypothetical protein K8354_00135 [Polaribacter litorisediminis]|uniref:hypothetical protein n=1 Tax=Polaribacter litorisediminis TaxID=1908341 RepID=UPI001CBAD9A2|nr:hypothetical protein [Polaribacter litorisediminis]UAM98274.1 hypothetical protein K8354_00135 [Polaribacter litorisediminis]
MRKVIFTSESHKMLQKSRGEGDIRFFCYQSLNEIDVARTEGMHEQLYEQQKFLINEIEFLNSRMIKITV